MPDGGTIGAAEGIAAQSSTTSPSVPARAQPPSVAASATVTMSHRGPRVMAVILGGPVKPDDGPPVRRDGPDVPDRIRRSSEMSLFAWLLAAQCSHDESGSRRRHLGNLRAAVPPLLRGRRPGVVPAVGVHPPGA